MKRKIPKEVTEGVEYYNKGGFNLSQSKSLAWADFFEEKMDNLAYHPRYANSFFGPEIRIDCYCYDCKDGGHLLPATANLFIRQHKDHNTKTFARK